MSFHFPSPHDMEAIIIYKITHCVVFKTKYCWAIWKIAVFCSQTNSAEKSRNEKPFGARFPLKLKGQNA